MVEMVLSRWQDDDGCSPFISLSVDMAFVMDTCNTINTLYGVVLIFARISNKMKQLGA